LITLLSRETQPAMLSDRIIKNAFFDNPAKYEMKFWQKLP
jgi:hypothetical protein